MGSGQGGPRPAVHNALFKQIFSDTEVAGGMLAALLPPEMAAAIDFGPLRLCPGEFASRAQSTRTTDLLFETRTADHPVLLRVNLEHQGRSDHFMPLRLREYGVDDAKAWLKQHPKAKRVPLVIPVVLYHGRRPWRGPRSYADLLDLPLGLRGALGVVPDPEFVLIDLAAMDDAELRRSMLPVIALLVLLALKNLRFAESAIDLLLSWRDLLNAVAHAPNGREALNTLFYYVARVAPDLTPQEVKVRLEPAVEAQAKEAVVTLYDRLMEQGMEKGLEQGMEQGLEKGELRGLRKALLNLLNLKFGEVSAADEARVAAASVAELETWIPRVLTAESAAAVFG